MTRAEPTAHTNLNTRGCTAGVDDMIYINGRGENMIQTYLKTKLRIVSNSTDIKLVSSEAVCRSK